MKRNERAYEIAFQTPQHLEEANRRCSLIGDLEEKVDKIIFVGMGGSGIIGDIIEEWLEDKTNVEIRVWKDYSLPAWINEEALIIAISYSGNTEETISATMEAVRRKSKIAVISSNGKIIKIAEKNRIPHIIVPGIFQPREAAPYLLIAAIKILRKIGIIGEYWKEEFKETLSTLKEMQREIAKDNYVKRIAEKIDGRIIIIYGYRPLRCAALRLKQQLNENSKSFAMMGVLPEAGHNEIEGWEENEKLLSNIAAIFIRDVEEDIRIRKRIEVFESLMKEKNTPTINIYSRGKSRLCRIMSTIYLGDLISIELANIKGVDASRIEAIIKLKRELSKLKG